jgi:hypothetical protein
LEMSSTRRIGSAIAGAAVAVMLICARSPG